MHSEESSEKAAQLYAAYMARRKKYADQIKVGTHSTLAGMLAHAVATTDLCMATYVYFAEQFAKLSKRRREENTAASLEARTRAASALDRIEKIKKEILAQKDAALREFLFQEAELQHGFAKDAVSQGLSQAQLSELEVKFAQAVFSLNHSSLEQLLTVSNAEDVRRVLRAIAALCVGLIPVVGEPISKMAESWALWQERRPDFETGAKTTSDILDQLDAFIYAGYQWCLIVQLVVDASSGVSKPDYEKAAAVVKARFDSLTG